MCVTNEKEKEVGLYGKFKVERTDGSSKPGGKHEHCDYFVLDLKHDPFSFPAIHAYIDACAKEYPLLAEDLKRKMEDVANLIFSGADDSAWDNPKNWNKGTVHQRTPGEETRTPATPVQVDMPCSKPECTGLMRPTGTNLLMGGSGARNNVHRCTVCGNKENYAKKYPYIEYK